MLLHPRDFAGITLFTPSSKETVDKMRLCVRVDNTLFSDSLNIQAVGNAEVHTCLILFGRYVEQTNYKGEVFS